MNTVSRQLEIEAKNSSKYAHVLLIDKLVSNIGFITKHGLSEGHIAPYTDIEFQLMKYQTCIIMKSQDCSYM